MPDRTPQELHELYERKDEADRTVRLTVHVSGLRPEFVYVRPVPSYPGNAQVELGGVSLDIGLAGSIEELRAVFEEVDRQLAVLEVESRVDAAVANDSDAGAEA